MSGQPTALQHEASPRKGSLCLHLSEGPKLIRSTIENLQSKLANFPRRTTQARKKCQPGQRRHASKFWLISSELTMSQKTHVSAHILSWVNIKRERGGTKQNWGSRQTRGADRLSPLLVPSFGCQHCWEHDEIHDTAPY